MKEKLRKQMLEKRNGISEIERKKKSGDILQRFAESAIYKNAQCIDCYVSVGSEVETWSMLHQAWKDGKKVAVPVTEKNGMMYFMEIECIEQLSLTRLGLWEPKGRKEWEHIPCEKDVFLIPGLAFDCRGKRLGYGGGFYDRYLEKYRGFPTIGLGFEVQILENVPWEAYDMDLQYILTEKRWVKCGENGA